MEPATSERHLHPPTSGLELDPYYYYGLEVDRNVSSLEPVLFDHGPESIPAEYLEQNVPQRLIETEGREVVERENPAGLTVQEPKGDPPRKRSWHRLVLALILFVIVVAIAVPVSVTQTRNSSRTTPSKVPVPALSSGVSSPAPSSSPHNGNDSTSGAFKGTGLVTAQSHNNENNSYLFFQHYTGQIRQLIAADERNAWTGGSNSDVIVGSNARNGTPLAVGGYIEDNTFWIHLFYIDKSNLLQDLVRSNVSDEWQEGTLGSFHIATSESQGVNLLGTYEFEFNNDMLLYYGTKDNLIQELRYISANQSWQSGFSFTTSNGNSGTQLSSTVGVDSIRQILLLNSAYELEVWWIDYNETSVASPAHPVGVWTRGPVATNATVSHNSSLSMINNGRLLYQDPSNNIIEIELVGYSESAGFKYHESLQDGRDALAAEPNTRFDTYAFSTEDNVSQWVVYLQTNASNIVEYRFDDHDYTVYTTRVIYA